MRIVIDRIEDDLACLDVEGTMIEIPVAALPTDSHEGDLLGFVKLDNSEIIKDGKDRLARLKSMSQTNSNDFDL